ncbi:hypothetical protein GCM10009861_05230 [Neomicrococcus aestuarii]
MLEQSQKRRLGRNQAPMRFLFRQPLKSSQKHDSVLIDEREDLRLKIRGVHVQLIGVTHGDSMADGFR